MRQHFGFLALKDLNYWLFKIFAMSATNVVKTEISNLVHTTRF